jgi:Tol biopolymer transport system component
MKNKHIMFLLFCLVVNSCSSPTRDRLSLTNTIINSPVVKQTLTYTPREIKTATVTKSECNEEMSNGLSGKLLLLEQGVAGNYEGSLDIYLFHFLSGSFQRITSDPGWDNSPAITRDGKRIAFTSNRNHQDYSSLFVIEIPEKINLQDTVELIKKPTEIVSSNLSWIYCPDWSYDDKWITYSRSTGSNTFIEIYNPGMNTGTRISNTINDAYMAVWSHYDNSLFIVNQKKYSSYGSKIMITNLNDVLSNIPPREIEVNKDIYANAGIDVDEKYQILLTIINNEKSGIYKISTRINNELIKIHDEESENSVFPIWSPNGEWIAFKAAENELSKIYLFNDLTNELLLAYQNPPFKTSSKVWSPDSKYIAFIEWRGERISYINVISVKSIIANSKGCNIKPIEIGPIDASMNILYSWIS